MPRLSGHATKDAHEIEDPTTSRPRPEPQLLADAADAMITEPPGRAMAGGKP